jgi:hypothetical protein
VASLLPLPYVDALTVAQTVVRLGMPPSTPAALQSIARPAGIMPLHGVPANETFTSAARATKTNGRMTAAFLEEDIYLYYITYKIKNPSIIMEYIYIESIFTIPPPSSPA